MDKQVPLYKHKIVEEGKLDEDKPATEELDALPDTMELLLAAGQIGTVCPPIEEQTSAAMDKQVPLYKHKIVEGGKLDEDKPATEELDALPDTPELLLTIGQIETVCPPIEEQTSAAMAVQPPLYKHKTLTLGALELLLTVGQIKTDCPPIARQISGAIAVQPPPYKHKTVPTGKLEDDEPSISPTEEL